MPQKSAIKRLSTANFNSLRSWAKEAAEKLEILGEMCRRRPSAAKANVDSIGLTRGLKPPPPSGSSFSAACKARIDFPEFMDERKPVNFKHRPFTTDKESFMAAPASAASAPAPQRPRVRRPRRARQANRRQ
jgi:hypothetical protein